MIAPKERTLAQIQHRRDTVRANVARHRARKRQRRLQDDDLTPLSKNTRFVNKTNSDFRSSPEDLTPATTKLAIEKPSSILSLVDRRQDLSLELRIHSALEKPLDCFVAPSASYFRGHADHQGSSAAAPHHWLTLLPQYARLHGSSPCLTLTAKAIALRAAAETEPRSELLRYSGEVYGAALQAFRDELAPNTYRLNTFSGKGHVQEVVVVLATSLALATYELSDFSSDFGAVGRWASHIGGIDAFVTTQGTTIKESKFGRELMSCWATQRSWLECLSAAGACEDLGRPKLRSVMKEGGARTTSMIPNPGFNLVPSAASQRKTLPNTDAAGHHALSELTTAALDLMTSCARVLRPITQVQSASYLREPESDVQGNINGHPDVWVRIKLLRTSLSAVREKVQELESSLGNIHTKGQCRGENPINQAGIEGMGYLQLRLFNLSADLFLTRAEVATTSVQHDLYKLYPQAESRSVNQIKAELLRVCDLLSIKFGFIGQLCGVLPRALAAYGA